MNTSGNFESSNRALHARCARRALIETILGGKITIAYPQELPSKTKKGRNK
jgi:hypothetical protein